jgi:hypothetical protein
MAFVHFSRDGGLGIIGDFLGLRLETFISSQLRIECGAIGLDRNSCFKIDAEFFCFDFC